MGRLGFSFSWKRLLGLTGLKQVFARKTGVPTSNTGIQRKLGAMILKEIFRK
jgi:hypothetical protein